MNQLTSYTLDPKGSLDTPRVKRNIVSTDLSSSAKTPACYKTDERYFCKDDCVWRSSCCQLTATWMRP